jgi:hypothetical protein
MRKEKFGLILIWLAGIVTLFALGLVENIPQDTEYHNFSDTRSFFFIPNTLNVLSNLPFLIVGALGFLSLIFKPLSSFNIDAQNKLAYLIFFLGTAFVCVGSSYYHWLPNNETLVWDRLPMTIAFMGLYSVIIGEFISKNTGRFLLFPLLLAGILSVLYWWYTESLGAGDLRYYAAVQFFPIITIPVILLFFKSSYSSVFGYWILLATYVVAKLFEHFDGEVHETLLVISGHSIKHIVAAIGVYILYKSYSIKKNT